MDRTLIIECNNKIGENVKINGWVQTRRDHGKIAFLDIRDRSAIIQVVLTGEKASGLGIEDVVSIEGKIKKRPENLVNPKISTGTIEMEGEKVEVLSKSNVLPIPIDGDGYDIDEELRLKYRYLDLRRERLAKNLRLRHKMISFIRNWLTDKDFVEIETPILTKATPEGARDFLVPSRLNIGKFYALPQSPQQYKQLLMVSGFERYFQIARCFRDEDPRKDRSYGEFTQLDLEMSFTSQEEILNLTEELFIELVEKVLEKKILEKPFPRFTHKEALEKFGSDKFDIRENKDPNVLAFAWVLDFPLFETTETRTLAPSHHPFTAPKDEDIGLLDTDPEKVRSWQHDLVCNGLEVGGGSIRITNPEIQRKIFKILGHSEKEIEEKFGHLLEAFKYGVPPHGGIAPGIDRLLMAMLSEENVREVVAFPMTAGGRSAVMDAPSEVESKQLNELGLSIKNLKK